MLEQSEGNSEHHQHAWLQWEVSQACFMGCEYCIVGYPERESVDSPPVDIQRAMNSLEQLGGQFTIQFTGGGEPFMCPDLPELLAALTARYQVEIFTNLATVKMRKVVPLVNTANLRIIASCHIKAMENMKLLDLFLVNYHVCQDAGITPYCTVVAHPELTAELDHWRDFFLRRGIDLTFVPFIGEYDGRRYPESYLASERTLLGLPSKESMKPIMLHTQTRLCNAGFNAGRISMNGDIYPCAYYQNESDKLGNIFSEFAFNPHVKKCSIADCACPYYASAPEFWELAKFLDSEYIDAFHRAQKHQHDMLIPEGNRLPVLSA